MEVRTFRKTLLQIYTNVLSRGLSQGSHFRQPLLVTATFSLPIRLSQVRRKFVAKLETRDTQTAIFYDVDYQQHTCSVGFISKFRKNADENSHLSKILETFFCSTY